MNVHPDAIVSVEQTTQSGSVDWAAVFAGTVCALALTFVLLSFGSAIGFAAVSPWSMSTGTAVGLAIGSAFWLLLTTVWANAFGGYVAARLRGRIAGSATHDTEFRDAAHGLIVWATATTVTAIAAILIAMGSASMLASTSSGTASGAGMSTSRSNVSSNVTGSPLDKLFRSAQPTPVPQDTKAEIGRLMVADMANKTLPADDRSYIADVVAAQTKIDKADAERRTDTAFTDIKTAADKARKAGIVFGFLTASIFLLGAVTAWWAAHQGGRHRDQGIIWHGWANRGWTTS